MKCDKLKRIESDQADVYLPCDKDVYEADSVDAAIAELKARIADLEKLNHDLCERVTENDDIRLHWEEVEQTSAENERLKAKLESVQASMYCDVVDANMEIRRLKRALWITRTATAKSEKDRWNAHIDCGNRRNRKDPAYVKTGKLLETSEWRKLWEDIERKCRAKAEEYK